MNLSKDHIIKYLNGELSHHEQYEIEKSMLDDPFLSDAMEGLMAIEDPEKRNEALKELEGFIESTYGKVKVVVPLYRNPLAIAAVITLLFLSVAVVVLIPDYREKALSFLPTKESKDQAEPIQQEDFDEKGEEIAIEPVMTDSTSVIVEEQSPEVTSIEISRVGDITTEEGAVQAEPLLSTNEETEIPEIDEDEILSSDLLVQDTIPAVVADTELADVSVALQEVAQEDLQGIRGRDEPAAAKKAAVMETRGLATEPLKTVSGVVTSAEDGQPLPGVNVFVTGTSRGAITDNSGSYLIEMNENENQLEFSFIGFQRREQIIEATGVYDISLPLDIQQLSEIVVVGDGTGEQRISEADRFASPVTGRTAFRNYLRDNVKYPAAAMENNVNGSVALEFTVSMDGSITNIAVTNSLGFGCDEEAIRLLNEGPEWQPAIRNGITTEERVRIVVQFSP